MCYHPMKKKDGTYEDISEYILRVATHMSKSSVETFVEYNKESIDYYQELNDKINPPVIEATKVEKFRIPEYA